MTARIAGNLAFVGIRRGTFEIMQSTRLVHVPRGIAKHTCVICLGTFHAILLLFVLQTAWYSITIGLFGLWLMIGMMLTPRPPQPSALLVIRVGVLYLFIDVMTSPQCHWPSTRQELRSASRSVRYFTPWRLGADVEAPPPDLYCKTGLRLKRRATVMHGTVSNKS